MRLGIKNPAAHPAAPAPLRSDRVFRSGDRVIIVSRADMPGWDVRRFRKLAIVFEGETYFVREKSRGRDSLYRYALQPWPSSLTDAPGGTVVYDEEFVRARDRDASTRRGSDVLYCLLLPLQPLIGFLWSGTKRRLESRCGISARRATGYSLILEAFAFLVHGVLLWGFGFLNLYSLALSASFSQMFPLIYMFAATLLLLPDVIVRYGATLMIDAAPSGFYEWFFRIFSRGR